MKWRMGTKFSMINGFTCKHILLINSITSTMKNTLLLASHAYCCILSLPTALAGLNIYYLHCLSWLPLEMHERFACGVDVAMSVFAENHIDNKRLLSWHKHHDWTVFSSCINCKRSSSPLGILLSMFWAPSIVVSMICISMTLTFFTSLIGLLDHVVIVYAICG